MAEAGRLGIPGQFNLHSKSLSLKKKNGMSIDSEPSVWPEKWNSRFFAFSPEPYKEGHFGDPHAEPNTGA